MILENEACFAWPCILFFEIAIKLIEGEKGTLFYCQMAYYYWWNTVLYMRKLGREFFTHCCQVWFLCTLGISLCFQIPYVNFVFYIFLANWAVPVSCLSYGGSPWTKLSFCVPMKSHRVWPELTSSNNSFIANWWNNI